MRCCSPTSMLSTPTVESQQGNDREGSQYQTGVYYTNDKAKRR